MTMNRVELVEKLERVAPALSSNDLVPVLSHFWFRNGELLCYNDQIAISTKLNMYFAGAVPGSTLVSLLSVSRAKEVEFFVGQDADNKKLPEGQLLIKAASSKLKLPFLPEENTKIFEMPKPDIKQALPVDMKAFLEAVESCTRSLKEDTSMPDSLGITLAFDKNGLNLYATNDATISYAHVKLKQHVHDDMRVCLSGNFCRQMLALAKLGDKSHVEFHSNYSLFQCGDNVLFGRLVDVQRPLDFQSVIESSYPKSLHNKSVAVPSKLQLMLERAVIITESKTERSKTAITVKDGIARFHSASEKGEVRDSVQLEEMQPDVSVTIDPRLFKVGYGAYAKMLLTEQCLIMVNGNSSLYLVSACA
jgi:DNA polymerase III sliding clamp (beta) subunit (PCNA family)